MNLYKVTVSGGDMSSNETIPFRLGKRWFMEVTNQTCAGNAYNYAEAKAWGERNEKIATSEY